MYSILVVEDDDSIVELLSYNIKKLGYNVYIANNGADGINMALELKPDLILMDWMLPEISGVNAIKEIRKKSDKNIPIIMLTAKCEEDDKIFSLDSGADDYVVKPFSPKELIARINANIRKYNGSYENKIQFKDIVIDIDNRIVLKNGKELKLNSKEYDIVLNFIKNQNVIFSREQMMDIIWGYDTELEIRTVDVHISRVRKIVGDDIIKTVWGMGYTLSK